MTDFFGKLKSSAGKMAFEAEKMARVNKAQGDLAQMKRQIEAQYTKLGETYYHNQNDLESKMPVFTEICAQIAELEQQVSAKNEEIQRLTAENYTVPGTAPAPAPAPAPAIASAPVPVEQAHEAPSPAQTKFCTNCGKEMAVAVKFCPDCGNKM
jgi:hypothetical protein